MKVNKERIAVIGLGYVGLPLALEISKYYEVVGYDVSSKRVKSLQHDKVDETCEVERAALISTTALFTDNPEDMAACTFFIVTVPTPIDHANHPDLTLVVKASETIGKYLKKGDVVVYESTVYPGVTEDVCGQVLEKVSSLTYLKDFTLGYSPERINPGDKIHRLSDIVKIISASDEATLERLQTVYGKVVKAGLFKASNIRTAEAAKVIENIQRDVNIALANELSLIFSKLNIDTHDVLDAAASKWNYVRYEPGLVGGHCIGVDPYYLTYCAEINGYHPEIILAGRRINNEMGREIALECIKNLVKMGAHQSSLTVTVFGATFKENVPDIRNSKVCDIVKTLVEFGVKVQVHDPRANYEEFLEEYGIQLTKEEELKPTQGYILAVKHTEYVNKGWKLITQLSPSQKVFVYDTKNLLPRETIPFNVILKRI